MYVKRLCAALKDRIARAGLLHFHLRMPLEIWCTYIWNLFLSFVFSGLRAAKNSTFTLGHPTVEVVPGTKD